jgi:4-amino-4-deoxy-L-arabinose transferase-like glycosyltransferase
MYPLLTLRHSIKELLRSIVAPAQSLDTTVARWEWGAVAVLVVLSLALGLPNLAAPSLWHDELVHVYVAKNIAATGWPALPSGNFYPSSTAYNYLLALFVGILGDDAFSVRLPSVLLGGFNTALVYFLCRNWLGRNTALWAAFFFATSPWQVGWARQARLYEFQITSYLLMLSLAWRFFTCPAPKAAPRFGIGAMLAYVIGLLTSFHSILYLGPPGAFAIFALLRSRVLKSRWSAAIATCTVLGLLTIASFYFNPNPVDRAAVFETGIGGRLLDQLRTDRYYYFRFLGGNLSLGFFLLALLGSAVLLFRRDPKTFWVLLAFWVPVLILTYLVGYRRHRFMFFAYPVYIMIYAHGLVVLLALLREYRRSLLHGAVALLVVLFLARLAYSQVQLMGDSVEAAAGADTTLATHHPRWKGPARWVKAHRADETILTTTYLPVRYYLGHVDNWFPNRYTKWEYQESGMEGLGSLEELKAFLQEHPRGYFLAESSRFDMWRYYGALVQDLGREVDWVEAHMAYIEEASSEDVHVWRWDFEENGVVHVP